jgi:hypothetical protein
MRKLLNNPKVVAVLAIAAVGFVAYSVKPERPRGGRPVVTEPVSETTEPEPAPLSGAQPAAPSGLDALVFNPAPADPFIVRKPVVLAASAAQPDLPDEEETVHLTALWSQAGASLALVNGRICEVGAVLGRLKLDEITRDGVWFTHAKGRNFISVGQRFVLRTAAQVRVAVSEN